MSSVYATFVAYGIDLGSDEERYDWETELPEWFFEYEGFTSRLADILEIPEAGPAPEWDRDSMSYREYFASPEHQEWQKLHDAREFPLDLDIQYYGHSDYGSAQMLIVRSSKIETEWKALKFDPFLLSHEQYTHDWDTNIEKALQLLGITLPESPETGWHLAPYYSS